MYRDADVGAIEAAWAARDTAQLTELGTRLGIALVPSTLATLNALLHRAGTGVRRRDLIATLLDAATGESGIAVFEWDRWLCLAVRHAHQVTIGFARGTKISKVWPELKPWQSHFPSNRKRLDPWAEARADDRVSFGLVASRAPATKAPPNTEELIAQIVENPHDMELRAVLADLLVEHDHIRGKLMRLAREIEVFPVQSDDRKKRQLVVSQLLRQHGRMLAGEIADYASEYTFAAGFVDVVTMTAAAFRDHGARLFAQQPVRRLKLQPATSATVATLAKSQTAFLRELEIFVNDYERTVSLAPLATARFDKLEALDLQGMAPVDDEVAFAALQAPNLRRLDFDAHVVATTLRGLATNRVVCDRLEELSIYPTMISVARRPDEVAIADEAFARLALPRLRRLVLCRCWFATPPRLAKLRERAPLLTDLEILD